MTELLSREREFLKLNEELNRMATATNTTSTFDHHNQSKHKTQRSTQQTNITMIGTKNGQETHRYYTYTKTKGPSTLMKKRGAGDCTSDAVVEAPMSSRHHHPPQPPHSSRNSTLSARGGELSSARHHAQTTPNTARHQKPRDDLGSNTAAVTSVATTIMTHGNTALLHPSQQPRRIVRSPESTVRCFSRLSNRSGGTNNNNSHTFTIKYRNPKFVESPSLEVLLKDESSTIRRPAGGASSVTASSNAVASTSGSASASGATSVESTTSMNDSEKASSGATIVRRSQLACAVSNGPTKKPLSTEGLIKFLKSKIIILEEDHDRISLEMNQQKELLEKTMERHKKVEQQRDQAFTKHNSLVEQLGKVESQLEEANNRLKERATEQSNQQKELETVRRELKVLAQANTNLEKRLYRANEDLENTKNALALVKNTERELKESMRIEVDSKDKQIRSLKKQRADLLNAYKKQLFLIDNLKRQNICIEQSKLIGFGEQEFTKVLEWNTKA